MKDFPSELLPVVGVNLTFHITIHTNDFMKDNLGRLLPVVGVNLTFHISFHTAVFMKAEICLVSG